jgi:hypothetical protein
VRQGSKGRALGCSDTLGDRWKFFSVMPKLEAYPTLEFAAGGGRELDEESELPQRKLVAKAITTEQLREEGVTCDRRNCL